MADFENLVSKFVTYLYKFKDAEGPQLERARTYFQDFARRFLDRVPESVKPEVSDQVKKSASIFFEKDAGKRDKIYDEVADVLNTLSEKRFSPSELKGIERRKATILKSKKDKDPVNTDKPAAVQPRKEPKKKPDTVVKTEEPTVPKVELPKVEEVPVVDDKVPIKPEVVQTKPDTPLRVDKSVQESPAVRVVEKVNNVLSRGKPQIHIASPDNLYHVFANPTSRTIHVMAKDNPYLSYRYRGELTPDTQSNVIKYFLGNSIKNPDFAKTLYELVSKSDKSSTWTPHLVGKGKVIILNSSGRHMTVPQGDIHDSFVQVVKDLAGGTLKPLRVDLPPAKSDTTQAAGPVVKPEIKKEPESKPVLPAAEPKRPSVKEPVKPQVEPEKIGSRMPGWGKAAMIGGMALPLAGVILHAMRGNNEQPLDQQAVLAQLQAEQDQKQRTAELQQTLRLVQMMKTLAQTMALLEKNRQAQQTQQGGSSDLGNILSMMQNLG